MENIGCGAFGRAMKAKRRSDQEVVVVKELLVGQMSESERAEVHILIVSHGFDVMSEPVLKKNLGLQVYSVADKK